MTTRLVGHYRLPYGNVTIEYELVHSDRKTLAIHVYPDGSVVVDAPLGSDLPTVEQRVRKRAGWVLRQQRHFQEFPSGVSLPRRYVSGESYRYLGRQYRLKIVDDTIERVYLSRGYLTVTIANKSDKSHIAHLIRDWYHSHARRVFTERLEVCFPRVESLGVMRPQIMIRDMKSRWGSCTATGRILLNLKLIQMPKDLIDYVILHELCHLIEHNHSAGFYALLERILPDWRERRERLNMIEVS